MFYPLGQFDQGHADIVHEVARRAGILVVVRAAPLDDEVPLHAMPALSVVSPAAGVREVALPKPGRLSEVRRSLQKAPWFRRLMRFRAGVEGNLSTLLRSFGLKRCLWKGWASFKAYIGLGVLTYNLRLLAGYATRA